VRAARGTGRLWLAPRLITLVAVTSCTSSACSRSATYLRDVSDQDAWRIPVEVSSRTAVVCYAGVRRRSRRGVRAAASSSTSAAVS
jgi:hypothetical protein